VAAKRGDVDGTIDAYLDHLTTERGLARHSIAAYGRLEDVSSYGDQSNLVFLQNLVTEELALRIRAKEMVAFLQKLPNLTFAQYRAFAESKMESRHPHDAANGRHHDHDQ